MEQKGEQPVRPIMSLDELICLTVRIAEKSGCVQFGAANGNPP
jgi:hypothetical protein